MKTYCVSVDQGETWVMLRAETLHKAMTAAAKQFPLIIYGTLVLGLKDLDKPKSKVKRVAITTSTSKQRARWCFYIE